MLRMIAASMIILASVGTAFGASQKADRPVGDDSTDSAPLNQKPQSAPEDHQVPPGTNDQGGGNSDASDTHAK